MEDIAVILLDTQVVIWSALKPDRLSKAAESAIRRARKSDGVSIASITLWELAHLIARGRVRATGSVESSVRKLIDGYVIKELTAEIATIAAQFPENYPGDPVDRVVGATARSEGIPLVTADERIQASRLITTVW